MYKGIQVFKGTTLVDKVAISPAQVRKKIDHMLTEGEHLTVNGASIILAELCGVLLATSRGGIRLKLPTVGSLTLFFLFFQNYPIIDDIFC